MKHVVLILTLLGMACCGRPSKEGHTGQAEEKVVKVAIKIDPVSLDPRFGGDRQTQNVVRLLSESLYRLDANDRPVPALAERAELSDDGLTWTFFLREAVWSNGEPITAYDFVYTWKWILDPNSPATYSDSFYPIRNATQAKLGLCSLDEVGIRALNPQVLQVHLEHPTPYFLEMVAHSRYAPVPAALDQQNMQWADRVATHVGSGPFVIESWEHDKRVVLRKNLRYWDVDNIQLDKICFIIIEDSCTALALAQQGLIDWLGEPLSGIPLELLPSLIEGGKLRLTPSTMVYRYAFNTAMPPFQSKKMRQAFAYAINRDALVKNIFRGRNQTTTSWLAPAVSLHDTPLFEDGDIAKAQELFEDALDELNLDRNHLPTITLSYSNYLDGDKAVAQAVQQQWQSAFNIPIALEHLDLATYRQRANSGELQIDACSWYSLVNDPIDNLQRFKYAIDTHNRSNWESPDYIALLDASDQELDLAKRREILKQAEALLADEMPVAPVFAITSAYIQQPWLDGVVVSSLGHSAEFRWATIDTEHREEVVTTP